MSSIKVLHVHDSDLDDPRIINAAMTGKKAGHEIYFCGWFLDSTLDVEDGLFKEMKWVKFNDRARYSQHFIPYIERIWKGPPYPRNRILVERQFKHVIDEIRPDIIHAHNIFAAHYCLSFGIPMVLDDHEYYSMAALAKHEGQKGKGVVKNAKHILWGKWEHEIADKCPIITVSEPISDHYRKFAKHVYTIPNYPLANTITISDEDFKETSKSQPVCSVYLGADSVANPSTFRNISGLHEIFLKNGGSNGLAGRLVRIGVKSPNKGYIRSYGNIPMQDAYRIMREEGHIGLIPWRRHWFHEYCVPNKSYEYAHCGLHLIIQSAITPVVKDYGGLCDTMETMEDLQEKLIYYNEHKDELDKKRRATFEYAKQHFIWEKEEHKILDAYKNA